MLKAYGDIAINTGRDADNAANLVQAKATTDVYNNTAIPISYQNPAIANISQTASIELVAGSQVQAGRNVYLRTYQATRSPRPTAKGTTLSGPVQHEHQRQPPQCQLHRHAEGGR